jgi:hypothetical protein
VFSSTTWILVAPYAVFTAAGVLLWRRSHSVATILVAAGFAAALLGQIAELLVSLKVAAVMHTHRDGTFYLVGHHAVPHHVALAGVCTAAVGLLWHASRRH